jgi:phosphoglycerol transferase MdoB-like AlkP superfamily enzyme
MNTIIKNSLFRQLLILYVTALVAFSAMRTFLYFRYYDHFSDLTFYETFSSFIMGIRVDTIMTSTFLGVLMLLVVIPSRLTMHTRFRKTVQHLMFVLLLGMLMASFGDTLYFEYVGRHMSTELMTGGGGDFFFLFDVIGKFYLWETISFVTLTTLLFIFWKRIINIEIEPKTFGLKSLGLAFALLLILFGTARGKIVDKPFGISDAFVTTKISSGNLALNGFYSFYRGSGSTGINHHHMDSQEAIKIAQSLLTSPKTYFDDPNYPLSRKFKNPDGKQYNIMVILIESLSSRYVDSFNGNLGLGVSKNLDKLAAEGIKFSNFYANGQRSIEGVTSVFSGITVPVGVRTLGRGLELSNLTYIGKLLKNIGYSTIAIRSAYRNSFRIGSVAQLAGYDEYYGSEDLAFDSPDERTDILPSFGKWDGMMYRDLSRRLKDKKKPFLAFSFNCNTHMLYRVPHKKWEKYKPHKDNTFKGFLNTMYYSDAMLGEFIEDAKKQPWFKDTVFFITGDHTYIHSKQNEEEIKDTIVFPEHKRLERFDVPLIVYAPHIFKPSTNGTIASQADLVPSIIDLVGIKESFSTVSNSFFDDEVEKRFAYLKGGNIEYMLTQDSYISHSLKQAIDKDGKDLSKEILSLDQTFSELVVKNKITKKETK